MKKHTVKKRMISAVLSGAMLLSCVSLPISTVTASATTTWIQSDFDDGVGLPWHLVQTAPASADFEIEDGTYNIRILNNGSRSNGGEGRWGLQFRHRKLSFHAGVTYHLHAEVTSDQDGEIYTYVSDLSRVTEIWHNSMGATDKAAGYEGTEYFAQSWDCLPVKAGETLVIDAKFMPEQDIEVGEWAFEFGGENEFQPVDCFPNGTTLKFDNMLLEDDQYINIPIVEKWFPMPFAVNQVGYLPNSTKTAVLHSDESIKESEFYLLKAETGEAVFKSNLSAQNKDADSGQFCRIADFSDVMLPGKYYLSLNGKSRASYDFEISDAVYEGIMSDAVNYFYQNRSDMPIKEDFITSTGENESKKPLAHDQYADQNDTGYVQQKWIKTYSNDDMEITASRIKQTANGGWYEAENHAKSVINGANAVWMLQNMYERSLSTDNAGRFSESAKEVVTPENHNKIPDILDETKYELDFLMSMMVPEGTKYQLIQGGGYTEVGEDTKQYAGMLYHQIQDSKWTGLAIHAWDYMESKDWKGIHRIVKPPTTQATLAAAAVFAQASRLFERYDKDYAKKLLECAETAFKAAKANPKLYPAYEAAICSRTTGDDNTADDFYWAACELYLTTGSKDYLKELESAKNYAYRLDYVLNGGENVNTATSFNWGGTGGYGTLSLALHKDMLDEKNAKALEDSIAEAADYYLALENNCSFSVPYKGAEPFSMISIPLTPSYGGYENDSNGIITNNAIVLAYAYDLTADKKYYQGAVTAMDYIFGENPMDISYVTGYGTYHVFNPNHKFWAHELDQTFPYAPSGVMVSGPNSGLNDPIVKGYGLKRGEVPAQKCYLDDIEAWSVNSCSLTLNASLAWMTGFLSVGKTAPQYPTGDVNGDHSIGVADAVVMNKFLSSQAILTEAQLYAADLNGDKTINAVDLTLLKRDLMHPAAIVID